MPAAMQAAMQECSFSETCLILFWAWPFELRVVSQALITIIIRTIVIKIITIVITIIVILKGKIFPWVGIIIPGADYVKPVVEF